MKCPNNAHVALVDGERFIVFRNEGQIFEPKLKVVAEPDIVGTNFSAGVRHQEEPGQRLGATDLNELAHAAAAAQWLNQQVLKGEINDLIVIADPKTLGEMRRHYHKELQRRLAGELDKAIANEPASVIEAAIARA